MSVRGLSYSVADQSFLTSKSLGILNLSAGLLKHLAGHRGLGQLDVLANRSWDPQLKEVPAHNIHHFDYAISNRMGRMYWDQIGVYRAARRTGQPWLLLTKGFAPLMRHGSPERVGVIMHDAMWDFYAQHYPHAVSGLEHAYFRRSCLAAMRHADLLLTISKFTRDELLRIADREGISPPAIVVMGIGFDPTPNPEPRTPGQEEILVLTSRQPHKRTDLAITFMERWADETAFTGSVHWVGTLPDGMEIPPRKNWVQHPRIPHDKFQALMSRVQCVVYTSECEGFGMPPVEATMAGACPVYSELEATREVMRGAGCPFSNDSYASFAAAMNRALVTEKEEISAWRNQLQERYHWPAVADRVVEAMSSIP